MRFKHVKSFNFPSKKTTNRVGCDATGDDRGTPTAFNPDSSHTSLSKNVFIVTDFVFFFLLFLRFSSAAGNFSQTQSAINQMKLYMRTLKAGDCFGSMSLPQNRQKTPSSARPPTSSLKCFLLLDNGSKRR